MKRFALLGPLLAVAIALPPAARSQEGVRSISAPLTHVLEVGGNRAVLAVDIRGIDSTGTGVISPLMGRVARPRSTYEAELSVASVTPILREFFASESPSPQSGRVYGLATDGAVRTIRSFANVSFTEVHFPVLDARDNSTGLVTVRFEAEAATDSTAPRPIEIIAPEDWQSSDFRIQIGDLPCGRVLKVDALTVGRTAPAPTRTGATRTPKTSSQMEVSNLKLTIPITDFDAWQDWFDRFVVAGEASSENELAGTIEFLSRDLRSTLFRYDVQNVGIVSLQALSPEANKEEIGRFTVELYVGSVQLR